jgi:hypothetical protein
MTMISDNMNPLTFKEGTHGRIYSEDNSPGVRGHIRSLDYYSDACHGLQPSLLGHVGSELGEGGNASNFHNFRVRSRTSEGET